MDAETWKVIVDTSQTVAAVAGGLSAVFAGWAIRKSSKERNNTHLLNHAKSSLERAFSALCDGTPPGTAPAADRLAWLTSARLIEEYKSTKLLIKDQLTLRECESHEEHWRHQFFLRLEPIATMTHEYYSYKPQGEEIHKVSAIILHHFAEWPKDKKDTLSKYGGYHGAIKRLGISPRWRSLSDYCSPSITRH
jgi:hypothetical protein